MVDPSAPIDPDTILQRSFTSVRRGYDPLEVQKFLMALAGELRSARERERDLEQRLAESERQVVELSEMSPARLTSLLGEETTRVLDAANVAANDIRLKAEENVARLLREGQDEVARLRREAEIVLDRKTREADEAAGAIVRRGETALQQAHIEAEKEIEAGRQRGREMVGEAQRVRERMLRDLARRRKLLRQQIEQLQAGRERLIAAYEVVRETVETATTELDIALPEAREAAEEAGRRIDDEAVQETLEQDLAELTAEVEAGLTLVDADTGADVDTEVDADVGEDAGGQPLPVRATDITTDASDAANAPDGGVAEPAAPESDAGVDDSEEPEPSTETAPVPVADLPLPPKGGPKAPDPVEGRHSSAVKVVRSAGDPATESSGAKVAGIFARIKEEADDDEPAASGAVLAGPPGKAGAGAGAGASSEAEDGDGDARPASLTERRDAAVAELERNLARRLKRELSDEQNEVLDAVRREKAVPGFDAVVPDPEDHVERYAGAALSILAASANAGTEFVGGTPRGGFGHVSDVAAEVGADIVAPLRERLERCFADADDDADELSERLRAQYRECKTQRIDGLASYAVLAAFNRGVLDGCEAGTKVQWVVEDGDTASPECDDNALAGNVTRGEPFPTGHTAPPAHPACRCLVAPSGVQA